MADTKSRKSPKLEEYFANVRKQKDSVRSRLQGVSKSNVAKTLWAIGKWSKDMEDAVWCLLDNRFPSLLARNSELKFSDGATVAQIGCYVGILLRGQGKLDREGRDYWLKPLREVGAIEAVTFDPSQKKFLPGHVVAKSPLSAYRLNADFASLIKSAGARNFAATCSQWISADQKRRRLEIFQQLETASRKSVGIGKHEQLIEDGIRIYAHYFLPTYKILYTDCKDGDRITYQQRKSLRAAGIDITLADAFPDVILYDHDANSLWFLEAVTSDGEVDSHKWNQLQALCKRCKKKLSGATTLYDSWKRFASRQAQVHNLCVGSRVWIKGDPTKELIVGEPEFPVSLVESAIMPDEDA